MSEENVTDSQIEGLNPMPDPEEQAEKRDAQEDDAVLLADLPPLRDPHKLRLRHQNRLIRIFAEAQPYMDKARDISPEEEDEEVDLNDPSFIAMMDLMEKIDEFCESIALEKDKYASWAEGKRIPHFMALLRRYMGALGK